MDEQPMPAAHPERRALNLGQKARAEGRVELPHRRRQLRVHPHILSEQKPGELEIVVAEQEEPLAAIDQVEHDPQRGRAVGAVIHEVAKLDQEPIRIGRVGEGAGVAMNVSHNPQGAIVRQGERGLTDHVRYMGLPLS